MGFTKRILPDPESLKKMRNEIGDDKEFLKMIVGKSDCLLGPAESLEIIRYIEEKVSRG